MRSGLLGLLRNTAEAMDYWLIAVVDSQTDSSRLLRRLALPVVSQRSSRLVIQVHQKRPNGQPYISPSTSSTDARHKARKPLGERLVSMQSRRQGGSSQIRMLPRLVRSHRRTDDHGGVQRPSCFSCSSTALTLGPIKFPTWVYKTAWRKRRLCASLSSSRRFSPVRYHLRRRLAHTIECNVCPPVASTTAMLRSELHMAAELCSTVPYSLLYACGLCSDRKDLQFTFGQYSGQLDCENTAPAGQYLGQTFGVNIPSWAYLQLTGSDLFDSTKAKQVAADSSSPPGGGSPPADTNSPRPQTTPILTSTQISPAAPTKPPAQNSDVSPSPSTPAAQSVPDTASGSETVTGGSSPGGGQGTMNASSISTLESGSSTTASGGSALPGGKPSAPVDRQHTATGPGTVPGQYHGD
ncbi:hypothetical protein NUW54_g12365 [Trametes sanguinea]|uniref:Uncharacterized protein n=1 Tax=Trametes sanguinea TaxID=158606 RepID=A0ACC1MYC3_9APHY|nr:hypothetical protein NUW54_g12365 [Trametes sanguinea]